MMPQFNHSPTSAQKPRPRSQPQPGHVYDVAIIGAGLAGSELAYALAQAGQDVLLVTQALDHISNLYAATLEDANLLTEGFIGGLSSSLSSASPTWELHRLVKSNLEATDGLHLLQSTITALKKDEAGLFHLSSWEGPNLSAKRVVLAVGAFLQARLSIENSQYPAEEAGRLSEVAYDFLANDLREQGFLLVEASAKAQTTDSTLGYEVNFLVLDKSELEGYGVKRLAGLYALGRCTAGEHSYHSVLTDAHRLAAELGDVGIGGKNA